MVEVTDEQFRRLLANAESKKKGSLQTCTDFYNGEKDREVLEMFLTAVEVHKRVEMMSDAEILTQLHLVLKDEAGEWWERVKGGVDSWTGFRSKIRREFAPTKPNYMIYQDIILSKQESNQLTEHYIAKKKMLFAQLPKPEHTEQQQIDMMYGGLRLPIRKILLRSMVTSLEGLLEAAKDVEKYLELQKEANQIISKYARKNDTEKKDILSQVKPGRLRCGFCRLRGHIAEACLKRKKALLEEAMAEKRIGDKSKEIITKYIVSLKPASSDPSSSIAEPNLLNIAAIKSEPC